MAEYHQQIIVYARVGNYAAERHVCDSIEEAQDAIALAAQEGDELAEMVASTDMVVA